MRFKMKAGIAATGILTGVSILGGVAWADTSGSIGNTIYKVTGQPSPFAGGTNTAQAFCNVGDIVIGGGFTLHSQGQNPQQPINDPTVGGSLFAVARDGTQYWQASGYSYAAQPNNSLTAYAICLHVSR